MTRVWREHPDAVDEYRAAAKWYEDKRSGLGDVFMDAVDLAIESILDPAITWGLYRDRERTPQIHSRSVAGFPFDVVYFLLDGDVLILAYAHERRRPGYWIDRVDD